MEKSCLDLHQMDIIVFFRMTNFKLLLVEEKLIENGFAKTAKAYILYRAENTKVRKSEADLVDIYRELTFTSAADADIKRENGIHPLFSR